MTEIEHSSSETLEQFREELRSELAADDTLFPHRAAFEAIELGKLVMGERRHIEVVFRGETQERVEERYYDTIGDFTDNPNDVPKYEAALRETVSDFLQKQTAKPWAKELQQGNVRVSFTEVSPTEKHPVNLSNREMGMLESGDESEILATIDGRPFHIQTAELLEDHFPEIVAVADRVKQVEAEPLHGAKIHGKFARAITIKDDEVARVSKENYLAVGRPLLALSCDDEEELVHTLRHERGHVVNGDVNEKKPHTRVANDLEYLGSPTELLLLIKDSTEWTAERLADVTDNNLEAIREIRALDKALTGIKQEVKDAAEQVRAYPWYDELDAMQVAADQNPDTGFISHMDTKPDGVKSGNALDSAARFHALLDVDEVDAYEWLDNSKRIAPLKNALYQLLHKHEDLIPDLQEVQRASGFTSQAAEILADMHSVQHAENPLAVAGSYERAAPLVGITGGGGLGDSHPANEDRVKYMGHFARRVMREREQAAQKPESPSR